MDQPRNRHVPSTRMRETDECVGCGGTAPSPSLELLDVATAMPSKLRLGYRAVAPQRGPPPFPITLLGGRRGNPASPEAHLKQV